MNFCVWTIEPEKYWDYLIASLGDHKDKMEKKLYQVGEQLGLKMPEIKQCVFEQRHMDVVNYHSEFNQYLGIQGGPLVYVSGELFSGAFTVKDIEAAIDRKLSLPTAGVW